MELFSRRCIVSPLILGFIFITLFHNVLSRHRIRHYKDRFKRQQGAHLYLPGSYVTEGGDGPDNGPWSEWSEPSACSRTCGGGVSSQYRVCAEGYSCQGPDKRHFSCNTQDCPDTGDFRSQQCSQFDNIPFEGTHYQWVPYTKAPNPCELNCMPRGERFYFRHAPNVIDGTRCNDETMDVCVAGKCQPVGCDMMLGSNAREDQCRVCGGDGSTCNTIENELPMKDMQVGYNDILLIPAGATNIKVEEVAPSNNYLAVRNTSGHYYLNGNWRIDFPRSLEFAGCKFHYERSPQGFSAPDIITCLGPTDEPLFIVLLYQDSNIPVRYEYSIPTNVVPGSESETYAWTFDQFTPCSQTCGGGYQYRNVTCAGRKTLEPVDRSLCDSNTEPESQKKCNEIACEAQWVPQPWKECSAPCGEGGVQTRDISCQQIVGNGYPTLADESECLKLHPKPPTEQKCNIGKVCAKWHTGPWKPCDHLCGDGKQTRKVQCYIKNDQNQVTVLEDAECEAIEPKPEAGKKCNVRPCEGVDWITSEWSGCDRICGLANETRKAHCASASKKVYSDELCDADQKPELVRECDTSNTVCEYLWYASQWSECSVTCGEGVQTRTIFCGVITSEGVKKVEKDKCDPSKHFETLRNCTGEQEECEGEWFSGPWGKCSKACGGGVRSKKVVCVKDDVVVDPSICGERTIIYAEEDCNTHSCSEDTIMPIDVTHPVDESEPPKKTKETSTEPSELSTMQDFTKETEISEGFEITTEQMVSESPKEDEEEYEIVPANECDDGEWVEAPQESEKLTEDRSKRSTESTVEGSTTEASFSLDDLMLSDGTTAVGGETESLETGSGAGPLTPVGTQSTDFTKSTDLSGSTDEEGSGTGPTVIEDTLDTKITFVSSELPKSTTESLLSSEISESTVSGTGSTEVSDVTTTTGITSSESSDITTESSSELTTASSASEITESTSSDLTSESTGSGLTTGSASSDLTTETGGSDLTTQSAGSDLTTGSASSDLTTVSSASALTTETSASDLTTGSSASDLTTETSTSDVTTGSSTSDLTTASSSSDLTTASSIDTSPSSETTDSSSSTETTGSTETSLSTDYTGSTETSIVTESSVSTSDVSGSTETSVSESEMTTVSGTTQTEFELGFIGESNVGEETEAVPTNLGSESTTEFTGSTEFVSTTEFTGSTETSTEFTGSTELTTGSSKVSAEITDSTELTTEFTGSTEATTEFTGSTEATTEFTGSTEATTEFTGSTEATTEFTGSTVQGTTTEFTGSTETVVTTEFTGTTVSLSEFSGRSSDVTGTTEEAYTTTEFTEGTGTTTEYTGTTTEFTGSTEIDIFTSATESGATEETVSPDLFGTTPIIEIFKKKPRLCKRRKVKTCKNTSYGCCWDNITPAEGPFDEGCPTPKTCKESKYGCCDDGVSAALGPKLAGCPSSHCNETLFGCCPDNKTAAEGNNNEGCPEPPPECTKSTYGCCKDNVTEAKGPEQKGCEKEKPKEEKEMEATTTIEPEGVTTELPEDCNNTTYRCCPDGVTTAEGPGFEGCNLPCSNSTFSCCPDGNTPAHGPSGEGCCLSAPFGCCPDNIVAATGVNLEGCGCQYSPYGCCPDNKTSARYYNNEGCGCQFTEFGCCPDSFTPANGPDYQGCLCHTFQFGCCPDGITSAQGPHQQGCGCRNTEFGCCSDEQTPSSGPNMEGCGCASSKFGCCLDGVSEAKGENFEECDTAPLNLQAGCSLPKERGTCRNYTVKWFFDMEYGGCSRFWYGGCDGNENRYKTKDECDQICVTPQGPDICNLPKVAGPCEGYYPSWYYDTELKHCAQFIYGGCLGNNNRFETREECMGLCVKDSSVDACEQPKEEGPCQGQYQRYYYDQDADQCLPFTYGGCKGNNNNFATVEACQQKCTAPGRKKDHCSLPRAQGNCTERLPKWYYDTPEKRCIPFYYSGCDGNQNNFDNKEACEADCPMEIVKDTCQLPAETGECANYVHHWYYDTREKQCREFYYGGCGGNENNFESQQRCQQRCEQPQTEEQPATQQTQPPALQQTQTPALQPSVPTQTVLEPFRTEMCLYPSDPGPCRSGIARYYYDRNDGVCKSFTYGGCDGNRNNFDSIDECLQYCGTAQDICTLPPVVGPCNGEIEQFYYDPANDSCLPFTFGGCGGNYNRFERKQDCEQRCRRAPPPQPTTIEPPPAPPFDIAMCYQNPDSGNCTNRLIAFFYDSETAKCSPFTYTGCFGNDNRFNSEEQCERQCGAFRGQGDFCNMERDPGPCRGYFVKYYYDKTAGRCEQFAFGGCQGNGNRFSSKEECEQICITHEERKPNISSAVPAPAPTEGESHPCQEVFDECTTLRCAYGVEAYIDENDCNRCQCHDPCRGVGCPENEQCAIDINRNKTSDQDADFIAICRESNKPGTCPNLEYSGTDNCVQECKTDADCTLNLKCCAYGCTTACVDPTPAQLVTQQPEHAYTESPVGFQPPMVDSKTYEPNVAAPIGDQAVLRCAVTGNPNPRIRWSKENIEIDGTQPRYRIRLDQSLQIITLHKTDSGIYLCTADNNIGEPITNQIKLDVVDSEPRPVTMVDRHDEPPVVVSLNAPTTLNCFALGYPFPAVTWWKDDSLLPLKTSEYEVRKDYSLLIHSVKLHNLGVYTCQAYNGFGKAASWAVTVRAKGPYHFTDPNDIKYRQFIVSPPEEPTTTTTTTTTPQPPRHWYLPVRPTPEPYVPPTAYTEPSNEIIPEPQPLPAAEVGVVPSYHIVPVRANITTSDQRYPVGSDIEIPCAIQGYPDPQVQWYKDNDPIHPTERIQISDTNTLTILKATNADSGVYQCEATNAYSRASSSLQLSIEGMYIHPSCTDNQFFANCQLIVKANFCGHKYYAKFCCRSCTKAGLLPVDGSHLASLHKQNALDNNVV